jgi:hypothetical protein
MRIRQVEKYKFLKVTVEFWEMVKVFVVTNTHLQLLSKLSLILQ